MMSERVTELTIQWMHNGGIAEFHKIKRKLQDSLPDDIYEVPQGNTGTAPVCFCQYESYSINASE